MFRFFMKNGVERVLQNTGCLTALSVATGSVGIFYEAKRREALQKAHPDCDVVSQWRSFGDVCGYNELSLRPKQDAEQKKPAQPSRRP